MLTITTSICPYQVTEPDSHLTRDGQKSGFSTRAADDALASFGEPERLTELHETYCEDGGSSCYDCSGRLNEAGEAKITQCIENVGIDWVSV